MNERSVCEVPRVRMHGIDAAKRREELPGFELKSPRQCRGLQEGFFDFDCGLVVVIELEDDVNETSKVGINRAVEHDLFISRVESAMLSVMIADFDAIEIG